ncbi:MAG: hypothetical protein ACE5DN_03725 [Flavobacteriales bacterium]
MGAGAEMTIDKKELSECLDSFSEWQTLKRWIGNINRIRWGIFTAIGAAIGAGLFAALDII